MCVIHVSRSTLAAARAEEHIAWKGGAQHYYGSMSVHDLRDLLPPELKVRGSRDRWGGGALLLCPLLVLAQSGLTRENEGEPSCVTAVCCCCCCTPSCRPSCFGLLMRAQTLKSCLAAYACTRQSRFKATILPPSPCRQGESVSRGHPFRHCHSPVAVCTRTQHALDFFGRGICFALWPAFSVLNGKQPKTLCVILHQYHLIIIIIDTTLDANKI